MSKAKDNISKSVLCDIRVNNIKHIMTANEAGNILDTLYIIYIQVFKLSGVSEVHGLYVKRLYLYPIYEKKKGCVFYSKITVDLCSLFFIIIKIKRNH